MDPKVEKLIIVGSGPAGLTAAIYAARGNLSPLVISGRQMGGQLMLTTDVDDFPGFEQGIQGPDLMVKMRSQAERFGTRFVDEDVESVDFSKKPFTVKSETQEFKAETVIIATGASAMWLGLPSEQKLIGKGVSACATCDGLFFKDKVVAVVGGGDTAMREAQHLTKLCKKVYLIHRRSEFRAQNALLEMIRKKPNVEFILDSTVEEVMGQDKVTGVRIKNTQNGKISELQLDGLFIAIGHKPNTGFLKGQLELDEQGYIKVREFTKTSADGVFYAGDVADKRYKQAVTAAAAGCQAALDVEGYIEHS